MAVAGGVAVVLRERAVADHKELDVFEQATARPEAFALVPVDLVERFANIYAASLEFDVNKGQSVDENGHVIAIRSLSFCLVLVQHLQTVVMDVLLVDQLDVLEASIIAVQLLHAVFLDAEGLLHDACIGSGDVLLEEVLPLVVGELHVVEQFQLTSQVGYQVLLAGNRQPVIRLLLQLLDKLPLECRLALIALLARGLRRILGNDRAFVRHGNVIYAIWYAWFTHTAGSPLPFSLNVSSRSR